MIKEKFMIDKRRMWWQGKHCWYDFWLCFVARYNYELCGSAEPDFKMPDKKVWKGGPLIGGTTLTSSPYPHSSDRLCSHLVKTSVVLFCKPGSLWTVEMSSGIELSVFNLHKTHRVVILGNLLNSPQYLLQNKKTETLMASTTKDFLQGWRRVNVSKIFSCLTNSKNAINLDMVFTRHQKHRFKAMELKKRCWFKLRTAHDYLWECGQHISSSLLYCPRELFSAVPKWTPAIFLANFPILFLQNQDKTAWIEQQGGCKSPGNIVSRLKKLILPHLSPDARSKISNHPFKMQCFACSGISWVW